MYIQILSRPLEVKLFFFSWIIYFRLVFQIIIASYFHQDKIILNLHKTFKIIMTIIMGISELEDIDKWMLKDGRRVVWLKASCDFLTSLEWFCMIAKKELLLISTCLNII